MENIKFLGQWPSLVDSKWRLKLPIKVAEKLNTDLVLVKRNKEDDCVEIHLKLSDTRKEDFPWVFKERVQGKDNKMRRILIPKEFRDSVSFYFGKRVTIAGHGGHLKLWPRP